MLGFSIGHCWLSICTGCIASLLLGYIGPVLVEIIGWVPSRCNFHQQLLFNRTALCSKSSNSTYSCNSTTSIMLGFRPLIKRAIVSSVSSSMLALTSQTSLGQPLEFLSHASAVTSWDKPLSHHPSHLCPCIYLPPLLSHHLSLIFIPPNKGIVWEFSCC